MKNNFLLCVAFVACFSVGFVCGMFAQSCIVDGRDGTTRDKIIAFVEKDVSKNHVVKCLDGTMPDKNGCCAGETYTDMGDLGFNCCPDVGDCFPPIPMGN